MKEEKSYCSYDSIPLWLICIRSLSNWNNFSVNLSPIINKELKNEIIYKKSYSSYINWLLIINPNNINFINDNYCEKIYELFHYILNVNAGPNNNNIIKTISYKIINSIKTILDFNGSYFTSSHPYENIINELLQNIMDYLIEEFKSKEEYNKFKNLMEDCKKELSNKKRIYILDEKEYNNDNSLNIKTTKEIIDEYEKMVKDCNDYNYLNNQNKTNDNLFIKAKDNIYNIYYKNNEVIFKGNIFSSFLYYREVEPIKMEEYLKKYQQIEKEKIENKINYWIKKVMNNFNINIDNLENNLKEIKILLEKILNFNGCNLVNNENYIKLINEGYNLLLEENGDFKE